MQLKISGPETMNKTDYDNCPVARTATLIGTRWTIVILRDLFMAETVRYQDFLKSLAGISPNTLSDRLKMLEKVGIIKRRIYQEHPPRAEYLLTKKGRELAPVLMAIRDWGEKHG